MNTKRKHLIAAIAAASALTCGGVTGLALSASHRSGFHQAELTTSSCHGPTGAAYIADPGYQGFTAVNTANCDVIQTYNVDDTPVPGDTGDYNYDGSDAGLALSGSMLWFAVTGTDNVAEIDTASLNPNNYNPTELVIPVGFMPSRIAATPDGTEVWVVDSGPETNSALYAVDVISTASDTVSAQIYVRSDPTDVAFSANGSLAYITTSAGLFVYKTVGKNQVAFVPGLGMPQSVAASPDGSQLYVTEMSTGMLATISTTTYNVVSQTPVGHEPWQVITSANGSTVYVANPDSDSISVVNAATGAVTNTIYVSGDPNAIALTPDGSQLWVTGNDSGILTVVNTASGQPVGQTNLGGYGPNSGDGLAPTGIVLTATPTAGS